MIKGNTVENASSVFVSFIMSNKISENDRKPPKWETEQEVQGRGED